MNPANHTSQTHAPSNPLAEGAGWPRLRYQPSGGCGLRNWLPAMILTLFLLPGHSWGAYQTPPNAVLKDLVSSRSKSDGTDPDGDTTTLVCSKDANGKVKLQISLEEEPSGTYEWVIKKGAQEIVKATASVNQGDRLQTGNSFTVTKPDLAIAPELHTLEVTQSGGFKRKIDFVIVEFITPAGDPVSAPVAAGSEGANEFTFDSATSGVLTMELKAKVPGIGSWPDTEKNKFKFELDGIGASSFAWKTPENTGGKVSASGDFITATATYTGLPSNNSEFGLKKARVKYDGNQVGEAKFEVFFLRDVTNHPQLGPYPGPRPKNWYYYWRQVYGTQHVMEYGGSGTGTAAEVKAMTEWSYTVAMNKQLITIYDSTVGKFKSFGVGEEFSGIDSYIGTVLHETKHVEQIALADALITSGGADSFQHGWSWKPARHNHWKKGVDGEWGFSAFDDDFNGTIDDAATAPPFEPGLGDDESLDHATWVWWPKSWTLPSPNAAPHPIESEAVNYADSNNAEHENARDDWGKPGKNHQTIDKYDD